MIEISKRENFYQQEYCGCVYSLRDTNRWRLQKGRKRIQLGQQYYGKENVQKDEQKHAQNPNPQPEEERH